MKESRTLGATCHRLGISMTLAIAVTGCGGARNRSVGPPKAAVKVDDSRPTDTTYRVRVAVRERENRIVEGIVRNHTLRVDQPKAFGADDTAPTPPETLAFALGSCLVSTGRLIAMQKKLNLRSLRAVVEGELDFARALGLSARERAGFIGFRITVTMDAEMSSEEKRRFLDEIYARCPMCDNLAHSTPVSYELAE